MGRKRRSWNDWNGPWRDQKRTTMQNYIYIYTCMTYNDRNQWKGKDIGHQQLDFQQHQKSSLKRWDKPAITNHNAYYYLTTHQPSTPKKDRKWKRSSHIIGLRNPSKSCLKLTVDFRSTLIVVSKLYHISEAANGDIFSPWSRQWQGFLNLAAFRGFLEAVEQRCSGAPEDHQLSQLSRQRNQLRFPQKMEMLGKASK